jgi:hypothetical protein
VVTSRGALGGLALAVLAVFLIDAVVFRVLYPYIVEPDSNSGSFETVFHAEATRRRDSRRQVLCLGDSRMPVRPKVADALPEGKRYKFAAASVPGTAPRAWYYELRDLDPDTRRYSAIVFVMGDFDDQDDAGVMADATRDLPLLAARLRLTDAFDFALSFNRPLYRWQAFRGVILKGTIYQRDVYEFLQHPIARWEKARLHRRDFASWAYGYLGQSGDMTGVTADWAARKAGGPPNVTATDRTIVEEWLFTPKPPNKGVLHAYRLKWLKRIVDRYRSSPTRLIFVRVPQFVIPLPERPKTRGAIRELASRSNVVLVDDNAFQALGHPEFFADPVHLNAEGSKLATRMIVERVVGMLSGGCAPGV